MIDIHNHLLPGLDDGAPDWEHSLAMARMAVRDGIEAVVCTPHWVSQYYENTRRIVLDRVEALRQRLALGGIPLAVYPGSELRLDFSLGEKLAAREVLSLNDTGRFILLELHEEIVPPRLEDLLFELQLQSVTTVLSHPERNCALLRDPARLFGLVQMGALCQVTSASLLGRFGSEVRRFATRLLEHRLVHVLATDAHGLRMRTPSLSEGYAQARKILGEESARSLVVDTPRRILEGLPVEPAAPLPFGGRNGRTGLDRLLSFLRRRR